LWRSHSDRHSFFGFKHTYLKYTFGYATNHEVPSSKSEKLKHLILEFLMKLSEFLIQGQRLRQQDRTLAIAYFEKCLQDLSITEVDASTTARISLDLAVELIATKQPQSWQRAQVLIQQAENCLDKNQNSDPNHEQKAYLLYVRAFLLLESGELSDVLNILQAAYDAYGNSREGQALIDDAIGQYYLKINDVESALTSFERSLSVRLEIEDECAIATSYTHLGQLYLSSGDINQAASLFQSTLDIALANSDNSLRLQALKGLAKVAIAENQWQSVIDLAKDAISSLREPVDTIEIGYLYCDLAEALLGDQQIEESLICIRVNALPRFRDYQYLRGIAIAKHLRGRIYTHRLLNGLDSLDEDAIETVEDSLLDASIAFEQFGMMSNYAKVLYDLACLYQLCSNSQFQYQYQGKSLRSLELSLSVLDQLGMSDTKLAAQVEAMLNQVMRGSF
jgi:tetratricopeptide (TPR) repeat protein